MHYVRLQQYNSAPLIETWLFNLLGKLGCLKLGFTLRNEVKKSQKRFNLSALPDVLLCRQPHSKRIGCLCEAFWNQHKDFNFVLSCQLNWFFHKYTWLILDLISAIIFKLVGKGATKEGGFTKPAIHLGSKLHVATCAHWLHYNIILFFFWPVLIQFICLSCNVQELCSTCDPVIPDPLFDRLHKTIFSHRTPTCADTSKRQQGSGGRRERRK